MTNAERIAALRGRHFGILAVEVRDYLDSVEHIMIKFEDSTNAQRVRGIVAEALLNGEAAKLRSKLDIVVENIYQRLPPGDYGRGDVRRTIEAALEEWEQDQ